MSFLPPFTYLQPARRHPYSVSMKLPPRTSRAPLPRIYGDAGRPLVVIDAGHGGHDPGALSTDGSLREKEVTLEVAKAIKNALLASGRVRVALTREDDRFLVLQERYGLARRLKADLFISVHCDSAGNPEATGATVYTLSEVASDKEAARLAARENKADILAGVDLGVASPDISSILIDLTQRETMNMSANFARLLGREAQPLIPIKANYHRMASLIVLKAPDMPSVLFETGYISNLNDAGAGMQELLAPEGVISIEFPDEVPPPEPPVAPPPTPQNIRTDEIHFEPGSARLTNIAKAILDAIKGYAFHDDAQVARLLVERHEGERERITIRVFPRR